MRLAATDPAAFDARTLLTLGINLGVIAFAVGTAIACFRATERARAAARVSAAAEADRYRQSESTLDTVLAAEPQALLIVARAGRRSCSSPTCRSGSACRAMPKRC